MITLAMENNDTKEVVSYNIWENEIECFSKGSLSRFDKHTNKKDNEIVKDLANNLIKQGYIIKSIMF